MSFGFGFGFPKNYVAALFSGSWSPASLFTTGVNGGWYDPSDITTLFQDAVGTLPVTAVEQPVGLMLDKSKGLVLGPEQVYTSSISGLPAGGGTRFYPVNMQNMVAGKPYKITFTISNYSGTGYVGLAGAAPAGVTQLQYLGNGTFSCIQFPTGSEVINFFTLNANTADFSNISVRELPGNHAFNNSGNSANFPVLSAKYNLLTKTEQFDDAYWNAQTLQTIVSANTSETTDPLGGNTADKLVATSVNSFHQRGSSALSATAGVPITLSISAKAGGYNYIQLGLAASNTYAEYASVVVNLSDGTNSGTGGQVGGWTAGTPVITPQGNSWYRIQVTITPDSTVSTAYVFLNVSDSATIAAFSGNNTSGIYIWGADLRVANDALNQPSYQRVNTSSDYDTMGFKPYLRFNGTNQWLQTNSIDFTNTAQMFVSAGVRKFSDSLQGTVAEFSLGSQNGSFALFAPPYAGGGYAVWSKGTVLDPNAYTATPLSPNTSVISGIGNISAPSATLRVNGTQVAQSTATQGTGNYGNYPLYMGARAGTSLWANIRFYGAVIAGKQASASEITNTETFINQKTGAY